MAQKFWVLSSVSKLARVGQSHAVMVAADLAAAVNQAEDSASQVDDQAVVFARVGETQASVHRPAAAAEATVQTVQVAISAALGHAASAITEEATAAVMVGVSVQDLEMEVDRFRVVVAADSAEIQETHRAVVDSDPAAQSIAHDSKLINKQQTATKILFTTSNDKNKIKCSIFVISSLLGEFRSFFFI